MFHYQRRRKGRRPNIINSLKRKAGHIDPSTYFPLPVPVPMHPERGTSKQYNPPTKIRSHYSQSPLQLASETIDIANRSNSNSSQGSMNDFQRVIKKAFPDKTRRERRNFEKLVTSKTINTPRRRSTSSLREKRNAIALLLQKATEAKNMLSPLPQVTRIEKRNLRRTGNAQRAAGKISRKRRK